VSGSGWCRRRAAPAGSSPGSRPCPRPGRRGRSARRAPPASRSTRWPAPGPPPPGRGTSEHGSLMKVTLDSCVVDSMHDTHGNAEAMTEWHEASPAGAPASQGGSTARARALGRPWPALPPQADRGITGGAAGGRGRGARRALSATPARRKKGAEKSRMYSSISSACTCAGRRPLIPLPYTLCRRPLTSIAWPPGHAHALAAGVSADAVLQLLCARAGRAQHTFKKSACARCETPACSRAFIRSSGPGGVQQAGPCTKATRPSTTRSKAPAERRSACYACACCTSWA